jgi:hypothetical protein
VLCTPFDVILNVETNQSKQEAWFMTVTSDVTQGGGGQSVTSAAAGLFGFASQKLLGGKTGEKREDFQVGARVGGGRVGGGRVGGGRVGGACVGGRPSRPRCHAVSLAHICVCTRVCACRDTAGRDTAGSGIACSGRYLSHAAALARGFPD